MKTHFLISCLLVAFISTVAQSTYKYPSINTSHKAETRFGYEFNDPYQALNDINIEATKTWIAAQEKMIDQYRRESFSDYTICQRMLTGYAIDLNKAPRPRKKNLPMYFQEKTNPDGLPIIYYKRSLKHEYEQLCPTNIFQYHDKDKLFLRGLEPSHDYKYLAIMISHSGSDWIDLRIRDIEGKKFLPEKIEWMKFSNLVWDKDGFFYLRYDEPTKGKEITEANKNQRLMYHKLGTAVETDKVIMESEDKDIGSIQFHPLDSDKIVILYYTKTEKGKTASVVAYFKPDSMQNGIKEFIITPHTGFNELTVVGTEGDKFLVHSTFKAPNGRVMLYDADKVNSGRVLIEQFKQPLRFVNNLKDRIFCIYYDMGKFLPIVFDTEGKLLKKLDIPDGFSIDGFHYTIDDSTTLYTLSSFETFSRSVKFDFKNLKTIIYDGSTEAMFKTGCTSKIVNYYSKDSTLIPMYIVHSKNTKPDENTPVLMYAYGGFGSSTEPSYNPGFKFFIQSGGILAVPLIRGGGEMGELWHKAGMRLKKQNSVDDFVSAAEYLIAGKYTSANKIAIHGGSNGGLLVGMAMVQRPELFKAAVPDAGVFDLLNFHKYSSAAYVGIREYGNPEDSTEFCNLMRLSPLHNVKAGVRYPATMAIASTHDDRVVPSHSYRFIATLQNETGVTGAPYYLYSEANQGHNMEGTLEDFQQMSLMYTFIFQQLGMNINKAHDPSQLSPIIEFMR